MKKKKIEFEHLKKYSTGNGGVITMKALVTILGVQLVECYENTTRYQADQLSEVKE